MKRKQTNTLTLALGSALAASLVATPAVAAENPFAATSLGNGYMVASNHGKAEEGKCGAKGDAKAQTKAQTKAQEGKCGEGKCGEGKCGGAMKAQGDAKKAEQGKTSAEKAKEGKCGEGKCGASMKK